MWQPAGTNFESGAQNAVEDKQGSFEICACNAKDVPLRSSLSRSRSPRSLALSHAFAAWHLLFATFSRHPKKSWKYKYNTSAKGEYRQKLVRPLVTSEAGKNRQDVYQSAAAGESFGGRRRTRRLLGIPETHLPHLRLPHQPDDQYLRAPLRTQYRSANPGEIQVSGMDFSHLRAKKNSGGGVESIKIDIGATRRMSHATKERPSDKVFPLRVYPCVFFFWVKRGWTSLGGKWENGWHSAGTSIGR